MGPRSQRYSKQLRLSGPSQSMCHGRRLCSISHISSPYGLRVDGPLVLAERARRFHSSERLLSMSPPMHDERIHHPMTEKTRTARTSKSRASEPYPWPAIDVIIMNCGSSTGSDDYVSTKRGCTTKFLSCVCLALTVRNGVEMYRRPIGPCQPPLRTAPNYIRTKPRSLLSA